MIGGIGLMNWLLAWQVSRIVAITSSTCASSTPARIVAWDCFRKPPCECSRVTRKSLSVSASTRAPASSGWTIATTSFIGRRLYPAPLDGPFDGQPRLVISGDARTDRVGRPSAHPFAPRHPSLGREAKNLIDLAADVRGHALLRAVAIDHDETAGLGRGEPQIALAHALVERTVVPMEAVPARRPGPRAEPRQRHRDGNVNEEGALRDERPHREAGHRPETVEVGAEALALVGEGRVEVPVGDDDLPLGERRPDHVAGVLRACGREEQSLRLGGEIDVARMKQHVADALSEGRPTWLAREHDVTPARSEGVG